MTIRDHIVCVLEKASLIGIIIGSLIASSMYVTAHPYVAPPAPTKTAVRGAQQASAISAKEVISLTNKNRQEAGVPNLATSQLLTQAAQAKADDMASKSYYAHVSPEGKSPLFWFNLVGYKFVNAGENLVIDRTTSEQVVSAWMESPDHRDNILRPQFTEIGVGTADGEYEGQKTTYVVQEFGMPMPTRSVPAPRVVDTAPVVTQTPTTQNMPPAMGITPDSTLSIPTVAVSHRQLNKLPKVKKSVSAVPSLSIKPVLDPFHKTSKALASNSTSTTAAQLTTAVTVIPAPTLLDVPAFSLPDIAPIVIPVLPTQYTNEPTITPRPASPREPAFTVIVHTFNTGFQDMIRKYVPI